MKAWSSELSSTYFISSNEAVTTVLNAYSKVNISYLGKYIEVLYLNHISVPVLVFHFQNRPMHNRWGM